MQTSRPNPELVPLPGQHWFVAGQSRGGALLCVFLGVFTVVAVPNIGRARQTTQAVSPPEVDRSAIAASVDRGLIFLAQQQRPDGSFGAGARRLEATGLSILAFLSAGESPANGRFGRVISLAGDHLVALVPDSGNVGAVDGSRTRGQAVAVLALSQVLGVEPDEARRHTLRAALTRATAVLVQAQSPDTGAWRDDLTSGEPRITLTAWCVIALHGARAAGVDVPTGALTRAGAYLSTCRTPAGGLADRPGPASSPSDRATAAGALALLLLTSSPSAANVSPELATALDYLAAHPQSVEANSPAELLFHAALSAQLGPTNLRSRIVAPALAQTLRRQNEDGGFPSPNTEDEPDAIHATALSLLTLTSPWRLLPAYTP